MENIMEKKKINFTAMQEKNIKFGNSRFLIRPYLSANDILVATSMCLSEVFKYADNERFEMFPEARIVFDIVVLNNCTNIDYEGIIFDDIISSGLMDIVRKNIFNYEEAWQMVLESIRLKNAQCSLEGMVSKFPSGDELEKSISNLSSLIVDLQQKDPDLMRKVVEVSMTTNSNLKSPDKKEIDNKNMPSVAKLNATPKSRKKK